MRRLLDSCLLPLHFCPTAQKCGDKSGELFVAPLPDLVSHAVTSSNRRFTSSRSPFFTAPGTVPTPPNVGCPPCARSVHSVSASSDVFGTAQTLALLMTCQQFRTSLTAPSSRDAFPPAPAGRLASTSPADHQFPAGARPSALCQVRRSFAAAIPS